MSPTIYQVIPVKTPILQQRAAHKLLSKSYREVIQCFLDSLLSLCFSPFPTFPFPIIHCNLPQFRGLSSPEVPQRLCIQKRMHHFSWENREAIQRNEHGPLPFPLLSHGFCLLVPAKEHGKGDPRTQEHILLHSREQTFIQYKPLSMTLLCRLHTSHVLSYKECIAALLSLWQTLFLAQKVAKQCEWLVRRKQRKGPVLI